jgi:hypothetical protein
VDAEKSFEAPTDRKGGRAYVDLVVTLDDNIELWCEFKTTGGLGMYANGIDQISRYVGAAGLRMGMARTHAQKLVHAPTPIGPSKRASPRVLIALISMTEIDLGRHDCWRTNRPIGDQGGYLWTGARGHLGKAFKPYKGNDHPYAPAHPELRSAQVRALPSPHRSPVYRAGLSGPSIEVSFAGTAAERVGAVDGETNGYRYAMDTTAERRHGDSRARVLVTLPAWDELDIPGRRVALARALGLAIDLFEAAADIKLDQS